MRSSAEWGLLTVTTETRSARALDRVGGPTRVPIICETIKQRIQVRRRGSHGAVVQEGGNTNQCVICFQILSLTRWPEERRQTLSAPTLQPPPKFQMDSHLESQLWEVAVEPRVFEGIAGGSGTTNPHC